MGSHAILPDEEDSDRESGEDETPLGELLAGQFADVDIDSVSAVRELREQE